MPAYRLPRNSGPHRIAAIALFRALLSQCRRIQLKISQRNELQNLIRNRFKQARLDQSTRRLKVSFEAGYEAIDLLDAAVAGEAQSQSRILQLLEDAPLKARQAPALAFIPLSKRQKRQGEPSKDEGASDKPKTSLFDRPLPLSELSGKRHVPVLVSANQIPMLRIKKPQPAHLSGYLSHRVRVRQKRHDRRHRLAEELSIAELEDDWDELVDRLRARKQGGIESAGRDEDRRGMMEPSWCDAIEDELDTVHTQLDEERRKNREMAEKMQAVIDREMALFEKEKAERKEQRAKRLLEEEARSDEKHTGT